MKEGAAVGSKRTGLNSLIRLTGTNGMTGLWASMEIDGAKRRSLFLFDQSGFGKVKRNEAQF